MQIYIHLPFCKQKCQYCDFNSYACQSDATIFSYLTALNRELKYAGKKFCNSKITTVYIGGGTPSMLDYRQIASIAKTVRDNFDLSALEEFTIEANPESIDEEKLKAYRDFGIDRISIGVQSLDERNLRSMGRLHTVCEAVEKIKLANKYFNNVSCDLIIGLPYDTKDKIAEEIEILAPLVKHISMYELSVEDGTPLAKRVAEDKVILPDDDEVADMFDVAIDTAKECGLERYEVSNFARDGYLSKHNYGYWTREEYIGIGAGAHSFIKTADGKQLLTNPIRFASPKDINAYIAGINCVNSFDDVPRTEMNVLNPVDEERERIMLGLRTARGVERSLIEGRIPSELRSFFKFDGGFISLTREGIAVMNSILVRILYQAN